MLLKRIEEYDHIYIACGYTDMQKGIDGLFSIIEHAPFRIRLTPSHL